MQVMIDLMKIITELKNKLCEGIKVRARLQDQIEGEKLSSHLLGKEKMRKGNHLLTNMKGKSGNLLAADTSAVLLFLKDHFKLMYDFVEGSSDEQLYLS